MESDGSALFGRVLVINENRLGRFAALCARRQCVLLSDVLSTTWFRHYPLLQVPTALVWAECFQTLVGRVCGS